ncbi:uncharacterized protein ARMOST_21646 [Armillaria ostoyae]|uniref:Uncharacterized protein n=1 Tax=Armillaria ostoyae TaxID=47428 RepID=A0A284SAN2_ARMOS|nr:uncharacterized protein ARMOST_21646 [Armillaria ostoyae]
MLLTEFLDLELPSLEYLNVVDQELFLDPARTTYPTLNIAQLRSIYISLKTYGSASDHDALGWWVESLKKAKDASIETITLSFTLVDYRLPPSGVPDVWSDLARVLSESAMGSIRDVVIGFSESYNQAEARQLYKTAVETTMASLIAREIVSVLEEGEAFEDQSAKPLADFFQNTVYNVVFLIASFLLDMSLLELASATSMLATTTSVLAYSFLTTFTKNIPLTIFILITLFILTIFAIYKTTMLLCVRRDRARWVSKQELILDLKSKPAGDKNSSSNVMNKPPPPISHLRPKTGDRIRSLHQWLITSCGFAAPIYLPLNIGCDSTNGSELSAVYEPKNSCREPSTTFTKHPSSLLLYGSKPGLDVGKYEGGYEEGVLQTALIRCML